MIFSLETSSDYIKDEKACFYGFKCSLVGYEWYTKAEEVCSIHIYNCQTGNLFAAFLCSISQKLVGGI